MEEELNLKIANNLYRLGEQVDELVNCGSCREYLASDFVDLMGLVFNDFEKLLVIRYGLNHENCISLEEKER